jgi:hypothetical protein
MELDGRIGIVAGGDQGRLGGLLKLWLVDQPAKMCRRSTYAGCSMASATYKARWRRSSAGYDRQAHPHPEGRLRLPAPIGLCVEREPGTPGDEYRTVGTWLALTSRAELIATLREGISSGGSSCSTTGSLRRQP